MRLRTSTRKTFRAIPKFGATVKSSPKTKSTFNTLRKEVAKLPQVQKFRESLANEPIETLTSMSEKIAKSRKRVEGATGLSLIPTDTRQVSISATASNDFTTSANMYMYRPPRS